MIDTTDEILMKRYSLSQSLSKKRKIYLDINFWIDFLKFLNGKNTRNSIPKLYDLIIDLLEKNKIILPISDIHFTEITKRIDINKFKSMINLMEKMSKNVCFISRDERINNEIVFCIREYFNIPDARLFLNNGLWTKPMFLIETLFPSYDDDHPFKINELDIQKSYVNYAWNLKFSDVYSLITEKSLIAFNPKEHERKLTDILVNGRDKNKNDYKTFNELLGIEFYGAMGSFKNIFDVLLKDYYSNFKPGNSEIANGFYQMKESERYIYFMDFISTHILESKNYQLLPAISICAGLHSLKRWDINSKYIDSDSFDFMHAEIALPYCDYFLTERNLCGLVKDKHLKFNEIFSCKVISNSEEAYNTLKKLTLTEDDKTHEKDGIYNIRSY